MTRTGRYAANTSVSSAQSRMEIEETLSRYGATSFAYGWDDKGNAVVAFAMHGKQVRFLLPLPDKQSKEFTLTRHRYPRQNSSSAAAKAWEQATCQRWRALLLCIKAKLEAVEVGITEFDDEFLAHIMVPGQSMTVSQWLRPQLDEAYRLNNGAPLPMLCLPAGGWVTMPTDTATAIKPKPIIFTGQSVPQIIAGTKTQTRRVVKPQPNECPRCEGRGWYEDCEAEHGCGGDEERCAVVCPVPVQTQVQCDCVHGFDDLPPCPYTVGQLLWVKETWCRPAYDDCDFNHPGYRHYILYKADEGKTRYPLGGNWTQYSRDFKWHSPIYMPRKDSRLTLEVVEVHKPERVQEISEADAKAEGAEAAMLRRRRGRMSRAAREVQKFQYRDSFHERWDSLHAKPKPVKRGGTIVRYESFPWEAGYEEREHRGLPHLVYGNPYVWPTSFKRVEQEGGAA